MGKSPQNQKREAATPVYSVHKEDSPGTIFSQSIRVPTFEKSQDSVEDFHKDYEALKRSYQRLIDENNTLKSDKSLYFGESFTTVAIERENEQVIQNYAGEVEELYEQLSESHEGIQRVLDSCGETHEECLELKRQLNYLKFIQDLQEYTKSVKINLVRGM